LARMIADLKALTDCQCVVVGGSIGLADGYLPLVAPLPAGQHHGDSVLRIMEPGK
jgi:hypothetical protein